MRTLAAALIGGALSLASTAADAKTVTIEMRNFVAGAGSMVFTPAYVEIARGDTVIFKAKDAGHNVATIPAFAPAGTPVVNGKINQDLSITFAKPGFYGFKCTPHYSLGMIALVRVGNAPKSAVPMGVVAAMPPLAKKRMAALLAKVN